jgi:hypothetical protein
MKQRKKRAAARPPGDSMNRPRTLIPPPPASPDLSECIIDIMTACDRAMLLVQHVLEGLDGGVRANVKPDLGRLSGELGAIRSFALCAGHDLLAGRQPAVPAGVAAPGGGVS